MKKNRKIIIEFIGTSRKFNPSIFWFESAISTQLNAEGLNFVDRIKIFRECKIKVSEE